MYAKTRPQRRGKQSCARGRADEGERLHIHGVSARGRALPDDDVQLVVLQCGVEDLLKRRLQSVNFVNEQNLFVADVGQYGGKVTLDLQRGARGLLKRHGKLVGNDRGQSCFAQPRRTVEQNMIQRFAARAGRFDCDCQVFFDLGLSDELCQALRPQL